VLQPISLFFSTPVQYHSLRERDDISSQHVEQDCAEAFMTRCDDICKNKF
jgi:hypothetical protein